MRDMHKWKAYEEETNKTILIARKLGIWHKKRIDCFGICGGLSLLKKKKQNIRSFDKS